MSMIDLYARRGMAQNFERSTKHVIDAVMLLNAAFTKAHFGDARSLAYCSHRTSMFGRIGSSVSAKR